MDWCRTPCVFAIILLSLANLAIAKPLAVQFLDQNQQPIEFVVVTVPDNKVTPANVPNNPAIMDQLNKQFSPMVIAVEQGRQVSFPNSDNIRHHVYSFSKAKRFETKLYANKPEAPILFDQPGLVVLGCNIHDNMIGYIFVSPWQDISVTDSKGNALLNTDKTPKTIEYWHPWSNKPDQIFSHNVKSWPINQPLIIEMSIQSPNNQPNQEKKGFGKRW